MSKEKYPHDVSEKKSNITGSVLEQNPPLSFRDYKIDYNRCLGSGVFGNVYPVLPRPENEKGFWSSWFPYIYDNIYRAHLNPKDKESKKYCVKIFKPAIQVLYENLDHPLPLRRPLDSFFEPLIEKRTNQVLHKYNVSGITFFDSGNRYSQFKTRVRGKTLKFYMNNGHFTNPNQFELRRNFVSFLRSLCQSHLVFCDVHAGNLMYDKYRQCWEIIDGEVKEVNADGLLDFDDEDLAGFLDRLTRFKNDDVQTIFRTLYESAKADVEYTEEHDEALLEKILNPPSSLSL